MKSPKVAAFALAMALSTLGNSQSFEVASVKRSTAPNFVFTIGQSGVTAMHVAASYIIRWAYGLQEIQLAPSADWIWAVPFDIFAKTTAPTNEATLRIMMQNLLTDRFALLVHWQTVSTKLEVMRVEASARSNFTPSLSLTLRFPFEGRGKWEGVEFTRLAQMCSVGASSDEQGIQVIDGTEMPGRWDFTMSTVMPEPVGDSSYLRQADSAASLRKALMQLGITFTHEAYPVKTVFIDHISRPTPN